MNEPPEWSEPNGFIDRMKVEGNVGIRVPCGAPAPLVANGGGYVGCNLTKDHGGQHEIVIKW